MSEATLAAYATLERELERARAEVERLKAVADAARQVKATAKLHSYDDWLIVDEPYLILLEALRALDDAVESVKRAAEREP